MYNMNINLLGVWIISFVMSFSGAYDVTSNDANLSAMEPSTQIHIDLRKNLEILSLSHVIVNLEQEQIPTTTTISEPKVTNATTIVCESSLEDFPSFFTHDQRKQGAILIPFFVGFYCFCLIAIICDKYFIPCVEKICDALNLSEDVAAATFMAIATSAPELFVNIIGTFITHSDIGIGTIVGSSMFNTLGVASVGGLFAASPIKIAWWPVTRDCFIYICAVIFLVLITWDGSVYWYEGLSLFIAYFVYFFIMYQNDRISKVVYKLIDQCTIRRKECQKNGNEVKIQIEHISGHHVDTPPLKFIDADVIERRRSTSVDQHAKYSIFVAPRGKWYSRGMFYFTWPIRFILYCTVPDPRKYPRVFPLTFVMCIVWIGSNSYLVSWMISVIGGTFQIPDAVLGLTFLAAGGCLPEAVSIAILSRKGEGKMGVSNALGANTMNILLSLGLPWFIKTMLVGGGDKERSINIESGSLEYTILTLILVAISLYFTLFFAKFRLSRKTGLITAVVYLIFLAFAIVSDLVIFPQRDCNVVAS